MLFTTPAVGETRLTLANLISSSYGPAILFFMALHEMRKSQPPGGDEPGFPFLFPFG